LDQRPIIVAVGGPNGAGKTTFYEAHLSGCGLRFLNANVLARELELEACAAAKIAATLREDLVKQRESFVFETVFSDPAGEKLAFLLAAAEAGYSVVLCFIGIADANRSEERVAMRASQGGHDVPADKLIARFPRSLRNLQLGIQVLPCVLAYDNDDLQTPFRLVAIYQNGRQTFLAKSVPGWLK
jgi:predicted ABC-type ATPase